jgi:tRNA modification GTPase
MFDNSKELNKEDKEILEFIKDRNAIILLNKIDLKENNLEQSEEILKTGKKIIKMSLLSESNLSDLYEELDIMFGLEKIKPDNEITITNIRHKELIEESLKHLEEAKKTLEQNMPVDIISINVKEIMQSLGKITGDNVSEDIIKEIFSKFCLGK